MEGDIEAEIQRWSSGAERLHRRRTAQNPWLHLEKHQPSDGDLRDLAQQEGVKRSRQALKCLGSSQFHNTRQ